MVNINRLNEMNKWYDDNPEYPFAREELISEVMDCLGNYETDIIIFIRSATQEQLEFLSMFMEDILDKFPSDMMECAIDYIISKCWKKESHEND